MNELISMPVIVEGEEYDYCEEESAAEVIGSLLAGVDGMEWKDDTLIKHTTSADVPIANFIPVPVEDIIYDNGAERSRFFRIKGLQSRNGKLVELPVVKVDSNDISNLNWVTAEWGFDAIENGTYLTLENLIRISNVFGVSLDYIMLRCENRKSPPESIDKADVEILAELKNFSPAEKERLLKHIELDNALKLNNIG